MGVAHLIKLFAFLFITKKLLLHTARYFLHIISEYTNIYSARHIFLLLSTKSLTLSTLVVVFSKKKLFLPPARLINVITTRIIVINY